MVFPTVFHMYFVVLHELVGATTMWQLWPTLSDRAFYTWSGC